MVILNVTNKYNMCGSPICRYNIYGFCIKKVSVDCPIWESPKQEIIYSKKYLDYHKGCYMCFHKSDLELVECCLKWVCYKCKSVQINSCKNCD